MSYEYAVITRDDGSQILVEVWTDEVIVIERPNKHATWGPPLSADKVSVPISLDVPAHADEYERMIEGWLEERQIRRAMEQGK